MSSESLTQIGKETSELPNESRLASSQGFGMSERDSLK